jgi:aspartyl-tRNA(Asn)/glutamyl-tRNA(Gln) amidotransferase subunit C
MNINSEDIKHIAKLARLDLTEEETTLYGLQLKDILNYISQLKEVNTDNTEPTAQVTGLKDVFRNDEIREWDEGEKREAIGQAPEAEGGFVRVKRILE